MKTDKVSITNEQLNLFVVCGKHYVNDAPDSVLKTAVEYVLEPAVKRLKKYERGAELLRLKYCKKTATKHIDYDKNKQLQYTEDDYKNLLNALDDLSEIEIELPACIVSMNEVPEEGLTYDIRRAFEGIVIPKRENKFEEEEEEHTTQEDPD